MPRGPRILAKIPRSLPVTESYFSMVSLPQFETYIRSARIAAGAARSAAKKTNQAMEADGRLHVRCLAFMISWRPVRWLWVLARRRAESTRLVAQTKTASEGCQAVRGQPAGAGCI